MDKKIMLERFNEEIKKMTVQQLIDEFQEYGIKVIGHTKDGEGSVTAFDEEETMIISYNSNIKAENYSFEEMLSKTFINTRTRQDFFSIPRLEFTESINFFEKDKFNAFPLEVA